MEEGTHPSDTPWQRMYEASVAAERAEMERINKEQRDEAWTFRDFGHGGRAITIAFPFVLLAMVMSWVLTDASWSIRLLLIALAVAAASASAPYEIRRARARRARQRQQFLERPQLPR